MKKTAIVVLVMLLHFSLIAESFGDETVSDTRIRLIFNNEEVFVKMNDNPTSKDFLSRLPLSLTFEEYAGTEKISNLQRKLNIQGAPSGGKPSVGDFTYYAPWGNLAIFYKDFGYANGLILLGKIESGTERLAGIKGNFSVTIEKVE